MDFVYNKNLMKPAITYKFGFLLRMKKLHAQSLIFSILCLFIAPRTLSQDSVPLVDDVYLNFKNQDQPDERFSHFFGTSNRYKQNSAYDWLDSVKYRSHVKNEDHWEIQFSVDDTVYAVNVATGTPIQALATTGDTNFKAIEQYKFVEYHKI